MNTNAAAAYGSGPVMSAQIQAVEALKALDQVDRSGSSEAQVQERVARRTESVIVTISPEARALRAADAQRATEAPMEAAPVARTVEPVAAAPVVAPVVRVELDPVDQLDARAAGPTAGAPAVETAGADESIMAPETNEQTTSDATDLGAAQVARPEQADDADDSEEPAQRAAAAAEAEADVAAESTDGDASDVQPI
jgi:hypothetical protein